MGLPPLICVGHAKCGTTLLDSIFRRSLGVGTPALAKELKFFLPRNYPVSATREQYFENFSSVGGGQRFSTTFEASPPYIHQAIDVFSEVLDNINRTLDDAVIILCYRHPVLRAYSHYIHNLHTFGLYGDGVFSPRPDLLRRPCGMSFEDALASTSRLVTKYTQTLELVLERMGRGRVRYFFLERDGRDVITWIKENLGASISSLLPEVPPNARVFERRPVPSYYFDDAGLHAFGSGAGEYMKYPDATAAEAKAAITSSSRWTLSLQPDQVRALTEEYFLDDIQRCGEISGQSYFHEYLEPVAHAESAESTPLDTLFTVHGHRIVSQGSKVRITRKQ